VLWAIVRKDGSLEILKLVRGLGLGLDESAVTALRQWKFRPGMKDGVPVDVGLNVDVSFTLR
jgi:periplasmic protein TonB